MIIKYLKNLWQISTYRYTLSYLLCDKKLTKIQRQVFDIFLDAEEHRYKTRNIIFKKHYTINTLISFSMFKSIPIFILIVLNARRLNIKTKLPNTLTTIIDRKDFSELYNMWKKQSWSNKIWSLRNLPLIAKYKNKYIVIDGHHRLVQQYKHNKILYWEVTVSNLNWLSLLRYK